MALLLALTAASLFALIALLFARLMNPSGAVELVLFLFAGWTGCIIPSGYCLSAPSLLSSSASWFAAGML